MPVLGFWLISGGVLDPPRSMVGWLSVSVCFFGRGEADGGVAVGAQSGELGFRAVPGVRVSR